MRRALACLGLYSCYTQHVDELLHKTWDGERISPAEARQLYGLPLETLGALAHRRRELAKANAFNGRGNEIITYSIDRNINYTNAGSNTGWSPWVFNSSTNLASPAFSSSPKSYWIWPPR